MSQEPLAREAEVAAFRDAVLTKLTYAVGKDPDHAFDHDWFEAIALAARDQMVAPALQPLPGPQLPELRLLIGDDLVELAADHLQDERVLVGEVVVELRLAGCGRGHDVVALVDVPRRAGHVADIAEAVDHLVRPVDGARLEREGLDPGRDVGTLCTQRRDPDAAWRHDEHGAAQRNGPASFGSLCGVPSKDGRRRSLLH